MNNPSKVLWAAIIIIGGIMALLLSTRCDPKPTPAQTAQIAVVSLCEARVLVMIDNSATRELLCKVLGDTPQNDPCKAYIVKAVGKVCDERH